MNTLRLSRRNSRRVLAAAMGVWLFGASHVAAAGRPVSFNATDGTPLTAMLYEASSRTAPAVILVHMLGRSKDEWAFVADRLQEAGMTALALDLRGHGRSSGNGSELAAMVGDVHGAVNWLSANPTLRPSAIAIVGASLGANLAALVAADVGAVRAVAMISPSLDYRGVRLDAGAMKKLASRAVWVAASNEDPYAVRTIRELVSHNAAAEQHLSAVRGHGTGLISVDQELARGLVDWLRRTLISY